MRFGQFGIVKVFLQISINDDCPKKTRRGSVRMMWLEGMAAAGC